MSLIIIFFITLLELLDATIEPVFEVCFLLGKENNNPTNPSKKQTSNTGSIVASNSSSKVIKNIIINDNQNENQNSKHIKFVDDNYKETKDNKALMHKSDSYITFSSKKNMDDLARFAKIDEHLEKLELFNFEMTGKTEATNKELNEVKLHIEQMELNYDKFNIQILENVDKLNIITNENKKNFGRLQEVIIKVKEELSGNDEGIMDLIMQAKNENKANNNVNNQDVQQQDGDGQTELKQIHTFEGNKTTESTYQEKGNLINNVKAINTKVNKININK